MHEHINSGHKEKLQDPQAFIKNLQPCYDFHYECMVIHTNSIWNFLYDTLVVLLAYQLWLSDWVYKVQYPQTFTEDLYPCHEHKLPTTLCFICHGIPSLVQKSSKVQQFYRNGTHKQRRRQGLPHDLCHIETAANAACFVPPPTPNHRTCCKDYLLDRF